MKGKFMKFEALRCQRPRTETVTRSRNRVEGKSLVTKRKMLTHRA